MTGFNLVACTITYDPCGKFPTATPERLFDACGLIPGFVMQALYRESSTPQEVFDYMTEAYGFGAYPIEGGLLMDDGSYFYPDDPAVYPYVMITFDEAQIEVIILQHAMVAIRRVGNTDAIVTRMD